MKRLSFPSIIRFGVLSLAVLLSCGVATNAAFDPQVLIRLCDGDGMGLSLHGQHLDSEKARALAPHVGRLISFNTVAVV